MSRCRRGLAVLLVLGAASCAGPDDDASDTPASPPVEAVAVSLSPIRTQAKATANYLVNYGSWDASEIEIARRHDLVILNPNRADLTRAQVAAIQGGGDPADPSRRVIVVCYVSIGEDSRTASRTDAELATDPRFRGDGSGPRMDPRGPHADGQSLAGIAPLGAPSNGGTGYASYYLDDVSVHDGAGNVGDGVPDRNGNFHGAFTNVGDPAWFAVVQDMTYGVDHAAGLREALTTSYGRGLGCDGVFLDTLDTMAPNAWTDAGSANETKFEWTAPGYALFLQRLRAAYPDIVVVHNRGLFFFNPRNPQFAFIPRGNLDFVMFESYRLNSSATDNPHPYFYPDNRFNFAPKLLAEAGREGGFRVLSLGYAEGPPDQMAEGTLVGASTLGTDSLVEDIRVTERLAGFRHYLTDASLTLVNPFVEDHADRTDDEPPVWTSTYNDHAAYPMIPGEATPRVGIQEVVAGQGALTVRWDVATDLNRVGYALYYRTTPFDFAADPTLTGATRVILSARPPASYTAIGPGIYANEATVTNLVEGRQYYLVVRAFDDAPVIHEERNQVVLTGTPTGAPPYLGRLRASNRATTLTYRAQYTGAWTWRRVYIDRDRIAGTGWASYGIGADLLIEEGALFRYTGNGTSWAWAYVGPVTRTSAAVDATMSYVQWDLDQAAVGADGGATRLVFQVQRTGAVNTSAIYEHDYTSTDPASPFVGAYVENDGARVYFHAEIGPTFAYRHVFIDDDADPTTGYAIGGVGARTMIENGSLYRQVGAGWTWSRVGSANQIAGAGGSYDWSILRSDVGASVGSPRFTVVFQANGGPPTYVAPVDVHAFTP